MGDLHKVAIDAVRDLLISMLNNGDWCQAKIIGSTLERLVNAQRAEENYQTTGKSA